MITAHDIQLFIFTRNRKEFLIRSIQSLLDQTTAISEIIVLDNSDNSETQNLFADITDHRIKYIRTMGKFGNYEKSLELANKKYVMLFHDDDVLHPDYISHAIKHLNERKNVALIASWSTTFNSDEEIEFTAPIETYYYFRNQNLFARHMYLGEGIAFSSAIYKTSNFLKTKSNYTSFGKYNDWPFLVNSIGNGSAVLLADSSLLYSRVHPDQDSVTRSNPLDLHQIVNWDSFFHARFGMKKFIYQKILNQRATRFASGKYQFELGNHDLNARQIELLSKEFTQKNLELIIDQQTYRKIDRFFYERFIPIFMKKNLVETQNARVQRFRKFPIRYFSEFSLLFSYMGFCVSKSDRVK
jgi:glycosyltransferase involved in cell wall biosynthesis